MEPNMSPPAKSTEKAVEKPTEKQTEKSKAAPKTSGAAAAAKAAAFIFKITKKKPGLPSFTQLPHTSSGILVVDNLIGGAPAEDGSGRTCPGFPRKRITELYGAESSGKTTLAIRAAIEVQKAGGSVAFLDYEHSLHHGYAKTMGLDYDQSKFLYYTPDTLEEGMKHIFICVNSGIDLVIVDSVSAMVPQSELDKNLSDPAKIGAQARAFSENLPKMVGWLDKAPPGTQGTAIIFINQIRSLINAGHGDPDNTSGGKALKFYDYVRLKLTRIRTDSIERKDPMSGKTRKFSYGNLVQVKVVKNKVTGTQGHTGEIFIRYGYGPDEYHSVIEAGIVHGIIRKEGAYFSYDSNRFQGKEKLRGFFVSNPKVFKEAQDRLVKSLLESAPQAIPDEDLNNEEEDILSGFKSQFGEDDSIDAAPEEIVVEGE